MTTAPNGCPQAKPSSTDLPSGLPWACAGAHRRTRDAFSRRSPPAVRLCGLWSGRWPAVPALRRDARSTAADQARPVSARPAAGDGRRRVRRSGPRCAARLQGAGTPRAGRSAGRGARRRSGRGAPPARWFRGPCGRALAGADSLRASCGAGSRRPACRPPLQVSGATTRVEGHLREHSAGPAAGRPRTGCHRPERARARKGLRRQVPTP